MVSVTGDRSSNGERLHKVIQFLVADAHHLNDSQALEVLERIVNGNLQVVRRALHAITEERLWRNVLAQDRGRELQHDYRFDQARRLLEAVRDGRECAPPNPLMAEGFARDKHVDVVVEHLSKMVREGASHSELDAFLQSETRYGLDNRLLLSRVSDHDRGDFASVEIFEAAQRAVGSDEIRHSEEDVALGEQRWFNRLDLPVAFEELRRRVPALGLTALELQADFHTEGGTVLLAEGRLERWRRRLNQDKTSLTIDPTALWRKRLVMHRLVSILGPSCASSDPLVRSDVALRRALDYFDSIIENT